MHRTGSGFSDGLGTAQGIIDLVHVEGRDHGLKGAQEYGGNPVISRRLNIAASMKAR